MKLIPLINTSLLFISLSASAAVPHTFVDGTPASASEVNENFSNLDTRVTAAEAVNCIDPEDYSTGESITYNPITTTVGQTISIDGIDHTIMLVPFLEEGSGKRYTLKFPAKTGTTFNLSFRHVRPGCYGSFLVSGYPAKLGYVKDQNYSISTSTNAFSIYVDTYEDEYGESLTIKVGETLIHFDHELFRANATSYSNTPYTGADLTDDIDVHNLATQDVTRSGIDAYADYIVITEAPL